MHVQYEDDHIRVCHGTVRQCLTCGGRMCDPCGAGETCAVGTDCQSAICTNGGQGGQKGCVPAACDPGDPGTPDGG